MKKLLLCLFIGVMVLGLTGCGSDPVEEVKQDLQDVQQEYGVVEEETAEVLVAKFNTEVMDNSSLNPASNEYLTTYEDSYWYGLITGIYLIVYPEEFTGDLSSDIVDYMVLYVDKDSENAAIVNEYMNYLVMANNPDITITEVEDLMIGARNTALAGTTVNNGKGIDVGYIDNEDNYQYQVIRLYK